MQPVNHAYSVFADLERLVYAGPDLREALARARAAYAAGDVQTVVVFDDTTGERSEVDARPEPEAAPHAWLAREASPQQHVGRGRPKLGVVSREVSLLPRHWDWLAAQPEGASAALRRLVDEARKGRAARDRARQALDAAYHFMSAVGGHRPGFEEASRDLYAGRFAAASARLAPWPIEVRDHLRRLVAVAEERARAAERESGGGTGDAAPGDAQIARAAPRGSGILGG
ncbi:MAG: DUF2239 family protein [Myxococcales bacterium]|nr:DUF2239 family protein [Myxococcales bacterium]